MLQNRLLSWSRYLYIAGLIIGTLLIIPSTWFPLQLGKLTVFLIFLLLSTLLFVFAGGAREFTKGSGGRAALLIVLLPLAYVLSYFFSVDRTIGITGFAIDPDSIIFIVICTLTFLLGFALFRNLRVSRVLLLSIAGMIAIATLFQFVVIIFGMSVVPSAAFADRSVNLIGKWDDLGLLVGLFAMLVVAWMEFMTTTHPRRIAGAIVLVVLFLLLAIIQFSTAWAMLLGFYLLFSLASFLAKRPMPGERLSWRSLPWIPLVAAIACALFLVWGSLVNSGLSNVFPVSSLEVRPSFSATLDVIKGAHGSSLERFVIGSGPQTFGEAWLAYKPVAVNQSQFWNLDFDVGFSTFMTALSSVGVLGAALWLLPLVLVLVGLIRAVRTEVFSPAEKIGAVTLSLSAVYLWCALLFYVPSQDLIILAFALSGAALGLSLSGRMGEEGILSSRVRFATLLLAAIFLIVVIWSGYATGLRFVSESYTNAGNNALNSNGIAAALSYAAKAQAVEKTGDDLRLAADAGNAQLQAIAATQNPTAQTQAAFTAQAQQTIPQAQAAIAMNPGDYRTYLSLGNIYALLTSLGVNGAYQNAKQVFLAAEGHNPTNPEIPLLLARLESLQNNTQAVTADLSQSLTLKPDYTDAILFLVQLDVANKDIPHAINAAQAAVQSAPGVASIWFELGLLYYSENDTKNAIPVLAQAINLQPGYANAQYFLGLSYAAQGDYKDAIAQFQALSQSNPNNSEVQLILGNLQAGKPPFTGAQPPVTSTPQNRTTAPISQ